MNLSVGQIYVRDGIALQQPYIHPLSTGFETHLDRTCTSLDIPTNKPDNRRPALAASSSDYALPYVYYMYAPPREVNVIMPDPYDDRCGLDQHR